MKINQAFTILSNAGGIRAARIITENKPNLRRVAVWRIAHQLRRGMPVAKIIHKKWFYGLLFYTNRHTLDPRPDTETLVDAVIGDKPKSPRILDVGTGTGCIICAIVNNIAGASGVGMDKSWRARRVARYNVRTHGLTKRIRICAGNFNDKNNYGKFDVIVANPPYIAVGDTRVNVGATFDPKIALYADNDGYAAYESIAKNMRQNLKHGGMLYVEIGIDMGARVRKIFTRHGWRFIRGHNDLAGIERVLIFG